MVLCKTFHIKFHRHVYSSIYIELYSSLGVELSRHEERGELAKKVLFVSLLTATVEQKKNVVYRNILKCHGFLEMQQTRSFLQFQSKNPVKNEADENVKGVTTSS